jgi:signal transduction histidine kinase
MRFNGSSVAALGVRPFLLALLAVFIAALLGFLLGNSLTNDLYHATRRVRLLGTEAVMSGSTALMRPARFTIVAELGKAIEDLAARFRVFAKAQEDAIFAREAATRMRGLFFAAVSHDLKSPLNAVLGFTELVRADRLTDGQIESLDVIQSRAQELLALIETILDAARVEAGQLSLVYDEVNFPELYSLALEKARQLSSDYALHIWDDIAPDIPPILADRLRISRALATFIAYSVRATQGGKMWVRAEMEDDRRVRVDVDVPSHLHSPKQLEDMISPGHNAEAREHRGMALGLRLARGLVELHGGSVRIIDRAEKGAMFCITLATADRRLSQPPARLGAASRPSDDETG